MRGKFIVIEGLEGSGKTSAISEVEKILYRKGIRNIVLTREPGGTPLAEIIRTLVKNSFNNDPITKYSELLMIYAARSQSVERLIKPALSNGSWVISDRHDLSSQAYQGGGRGIDVKLLKMLRRVTLGNFQPDLTLYLDILPSSGISRIQGRRNLDRFETESLDFLKKTRKRYKELIKNDKKIISINVNRSIAAVHKSIRSNLTKWLTKTL